MIWHTRYMTDSKKGMTRVADLGPTGDAVRRQIEKLRLSQNLTYAELSRRLSEFGRPLNTLALRRIEAGARRVDVDDLVALALALQVNPNALLMETDLAAADTDERSRVTNNVEHYADVHWSWLYGIWPLHGEESQLVFQRRVMPPGRTIAEPEALSGHATGAEPGDLERAIAAVVRKMIARGEVAPGTSGLEDDDGND